MDTKGKMIKIFPNPSFSKTSNPVDPGVFYRVPEHGGWFYLDENTGKEQIIVLARKDKLADPEKVCKKYLTRQVMIASAGSPSSQTKGLSRGLKSVREELPHTKTTIPEPTDTSNVFVWKRYFIHK